MMQIFEAYQIKKSEGPQALADLNQYRGVVAYSEQSHLALLRARDFLSILLPFLDSSTIGIPW
jgi:hypothetical protein